MICTQISKLHKQLDTTFVYVTHDQTEAMTLGTRIVVMKDGVIQQIDTPQNLYEKPENLFVAGFIGSPQMNFIECDCLEEAGKVCLKIEDKLVKLPDGKAEAVKEILDRIYV